MSQKPISMIVNCSGNVGKTTLAQEIFVGLMAHRYVAVETINAGGAGETFAGKDIEEILTAALKEDGPVVIDVGSSNIEAFLAAMAEVREFVLQFVNIVVIPFTPDGKVWDDVKTTIAGLKELGLPPARIVLVANRVGLDDERTVEKWFEEAAGMKVQRLRNIINESAAVARGQVKARAEEPLLTPAELAKVPKAEVPGRIKAAVHAGQAKGALVALEDVAKDLQRMMGHVKA